MQKGSLRISVSYLLWMSVLAVVGGCSGMKSVDSAMTEAYLGKQQAEARILNAKAVEKSGDLPRQRELLENALTKDELLGEAHNNLGIVLYKQGDYYKAACRFQRASDLLAGSPTPLVNLAILHAELGQWDRALPYARRARERDSHHIEALTILAICLIENEDRTKELDGVLRQLAMRTTKESIRKWAIGHSKAIQDQESP